MEGKLTSKARRALERFARKAYSMRSPQFKAIKPNYRKNVLALKRKPAA